MKRNKLALNRETLVALDRERLADVGGGNGQGPLSQIGGCQSRLPTQCTPTKTQFFCMQGGQPQ
jgi:hypothetical protein